MIDEVDQRAHCVLLGAAAEDQLIEDVEDEDGHRSAQSLLDIGEAKGGVGENLGARK